MSRTQFKDDIAVTITPRHEGDFGFMSMSGVGTPESNAAHALSEAERLLSEVKRHVDAFSDARVTYKIRTRCEHCGNVEDLAPGPPRWPDCCDAEQMEFLAAHSRETDEFFIARGMTDPEYLAELRAELPVREIPGFEGTSDALNALTTRAVPDDAAPGGAS